MPLESRKASPDNPCRVFRGELGCFTTGWQDYVELTGGVEHEMKRDPRLAAAIQRLFKRHARTIPRFLASGYEHRTADTYGTSFIAIVTECSSGAPSWDLRRPGKYWREQCNLYSEISYI